MEDNRIIECIERAHYILSNLMAVKPGEDKDGNKNQPDPETIKA